MKQEKEEDEKVAYHLKAGKQLVRRGKH